MDGSNIINLFEQQVQEHPNYCAVIHNNQVLSYKLLNEKANQLAHYLTKAGIVNDSPIAICLDRSTELLVTMIAVLKAGGGYLPIDASHPKERLALILNKSKAPILITTSLYKDKFTGYQGQLILIDAIQNTMNKAPIHNINGPISPNQLAYVIYTSGSTGAPKGVQIEHANVVNYCQWFAQYSESRTQERIDFSSNHIFDMAVTITLVPLMLGQTVILCDDRTKKDVQLYFKFLNQYKINLIKLTPSFFKVFIEAAKQHQIKLPQLKSLIIGGENLCTADCKAWLELYPQTRLFNEYGPTETTVGATQYTVTTENIDSLDINVPIGSAGKEMSCFILDADNKLLADGEVGELYIGGAGVARGYINEPELTNSKFIDAAFMGSQHKRLYRTGDLCRKNSAGFFEYMGRIDHQIKIRGFRIDPSEIEMLLSEHPGVLSAAVLAQPDSLNEMRLVAYYILKDQNNTLSFSQLRAYLQQSLPDYIIPTAFVCVEAFPLNANGKLDRSALEIPEFSRKTEYRMPQTETEQLLSELWAKELGVKSVGIDDDFFELGGHSLAAARIISQINHLLGKSISFQNLYQEPTVAQLSLLVDSAVVNHEERENIPQNPDLDLFSLSDFQLMLWLSHAFEPKAGKLNIVARKRVKGQVNKDQLEVAFQALVNKQNVLLYQVMKSRPAQRVQETMEIRVADFNLVKFTKEQTEIELENSLQELRTLYPWPQNAPLLYARLFYLAGDAVELQIAMPHIICDEDSLHILFNDLSRFYTTKAAELPTADLSNAADYQKYIMNEHQYFQNFLDRDLQFWNDYLQNASLFTVPKQYVVKNMRKAQIPYSSYHEIAAEDLASLQEYCTKNHLSIHDALCAALLLALRDKSGDYRGDAPYLYVNIVKSTRDDPDYDQTIGCFLRLEPIKIAMGKQSTLEGLAEQIRQAKMDTSFYQRCPSLIKLASTSTLREKNKRINSFFINLFLAIYSTFSGISDIYRKIFKLCFSRLVSFDRKNKFLINLNIQNPINAENQLPKFLGLDTLSMQNKQHDLLNIDSVLDVCIISDSQSGISHIVLSANLQLGYRKQIANKMISQIRQANVVH